MIALQGTRGPTRLAPGLVVVDAPMALARETAERFAGIAQEARAGAGRFTAALAGGSISKSLCALLASAPYRSRIPWSQPHVFWGDERCVSPDYPESQ